MKKVIYCVILLTLVLGGCRNEGRTLNKSTDEAGINKGPDITDYLLPPENSKPRIEKITHVVIHFISNAAENPKSPYEVKDIYTLFKEYGVSSNYLIDREGKIYRIVPEEQVAFHAGKGKLEGFPEYENKLNEYSIGIELLAIGTREEMIDIIPKGSYDSINPSLIGYTEAQYKSLKSLLEDITRRNPSIVWDRKHIIGHDEYAAGRKTDPGRLFHWSKIGF